jgi:hypothetical protein
MNEEKNFSEIPAGACLLTVGEFELGDNGENAKSARIQMVARSGNSINHWYWGKVVHDFSGMHMHKSRLPIDYCHDDKEVIGYLNHFDASSGDLVTSGALVPFKESDRATEIIHKNKQGVPYEASINFGGDGIKIEEIPENFVTTVNGREFTGPGVVIREFPLRGVAVCPYGADGNTDSMVFGNNEKKFKASVFTGPRAKTKETQMADNKSSVEVAAAVEAPKPEKLEQVENKQEVAVEAVKQTEEKKAEELKTVEALKPVEGLEAPVAAVESKKEELSKEEFLKIADEFGNEIAVQIVKAGGDYNSAVKMAYDKAKTELEAVKSEITSLKANGQPVKVVEAVDRKKTKLFGNK